MRYEYSTTGQCEVEGCDNPHRSRGLCGTHYQQRRRAGDFTGPCIRSGCHKASYARGLCVAHYNELRRAGGHGQLCQIDGCGKGICGRGYCQFHYDRFMRGADLTAPRYGDKGYWLSPAGYRMVRRHGHPNAAVDGQMPEHRWIMAEHLGRPLLPDETVHHINGNRQDNRVENLELWVSHHGAGQRIEDRIADAVEILSRYAPAALANVEG